MTSRDDVIARIKALRARAADAASSEAEAEAAARIAAKIIAEHEVSEAELIDRGTSGISEGEHNGQRSRMHPTLHVCSFSIGRLSECMSLIRGGANIWVGQPEDVEFALYLCELIQGASERAYQDHRQGRFTRAPSAKYRRSFHMGFGLGLAKRMEAMVAERESARRAKSETGTSLVVIKNALINEYMEKTRPGIASRRVKKIRPDEYALLHGLKASDRITLTRPLDSATSPEAVMKGDAA